MSKEYGVFDILGPVMIGPSSSHTAGAAKLGRIAQKIAGDNIKKVTFYLHGSFAKTYKGHGTDKALLAGVLKMEPQDEHLKNSFDIAAREGLEYEFIETDLGDVHPNTVKFKFDLYNGKVMTVTGSSIGGGSILITEVDGESVELTGEYPAIITKHKDKPGIITAVSSVLSNLGVNIAFMKVFRKRRGQTASMVVETDGIIPKDAINYISKIEGIEDVKVINPI